MQINYEQYYWWPPDGPTYEFYYGCVPENDIASCVNYPGPVFDQGKNYCKEKIIAVLQAITNWRQEGLGTRLAIGLFGCPQCVPQSQTQTPFQREKGGLVFKTMCT